MLYTLKVQHYGDPTTTADADILGRTTLPFLFECHSILPDAASGNVDMLLEMVDGG
jgi:hypothetical protein